MGVNTLLARNSLPTGAQVPVGRGGDLIIDVMTTSDPWSPDFIIPAWVKDPMTLVCYYINRMNRRFSRDGKQWTPPLGSEEVKYVRAAKILLGRLGTEKAIRFVADSVRAAYHPPSLQWIVTRLDKIKEGEYKCPHVIPSEQQLMLIP